MITAGMEAAAAGLGQGEKIPSILLSCVSKAEDVALKVYFFKSLVNFIQSKRDKLAFPRQSKVIFLLYPSDMSQLRFIHWSSEGEKMRGWEAGRVGTRRDRRSEPPDGHLDKSVTSFHAKFCS